MSFGCEDLLSVVLPALLRRNPRALTAGTVVQFIVPGVEECRVFYTFGDDDVMVGRGIADRVDLTISLEPEDLERFLDQNLDFEHALRTKRARVMGNTELLLGLSTAIAGGAA